VITSLMSGWRGGCLPKGTCDCAVMRSGGGHGGDPLGEDPCAASVGRNDRSGCTPHYTAHVTWPRRRAAHVTARWDAWRCGATIEKARVGRDVSQFLVNCVYSDLRLK
jgi:hypothetical protein